MSKRNGRRAPRDFESGQERAVALVISLKTVRQRRTCQRLMALWPLEATLAVPGLAIILAAFTSLGTQTEWVRPASVVGVLMLLGVAPVRDLWRQGKNGLGKTARGPRKGQNRD